MKSDRRSLNSILIKTTHKIGTERMPQKPKQKSLTVVKLDTMETNKQNGRRQCKKNEKIGNTNPIAFSTQAQKSKMGKD